MPTEDQKPASLKLRTTNYLKNLLDTGSNDAKYVPEKTLVQAARGLVANHHQGPSFEPDHETGVIRYRTHCGCRHCEWMTPIAQLTLPEEEAQQPPTPGGKVIRINPGE